MAKKTPWDDKWEIEREIGGGGQGLTYLVRNKLDSSLGVLKRLKNNKSVAQRARMNREAANLSVLNDSFALWMMAAGKVLPDLTTTDANVFEPATNRVWSDRSVHGVKLIGELSG